MKSNRLLLPFLAVLLFYACGSPQTENAALEKAPVYKIAYNVLYDAEADNYEIFVMDMDGDNKKNISNWKGVVWTYYAWKDKIYFVSDRDTAHRHYFLHEMNTDGENVRKVTDFRLKDSWFASRKGNAEFIINPHKSVDSTAFYIIRSSDGELMKKVNTGLPYFSDPLFSPDGKQIVFRGGLFKSKRTAGFIDELYIIDENGKNLRQLTHYPKNDTTAEWYAYKAGPPRWHPTGNFITYQSKQNGKYSLYAVTLDGQKQWKLTENRQEEGWHCWSPDGKWLAVEVFNPDQSQFHIGLMDWASKEMTILTDTTYRYQQAPVFVEVR